METELQPIRGWKGYKKESRKTVYKSCALHLALCESPGYSSEQLRSVSNKQRRAVTAPLDLMPSNSDMNIM